MKERQSKPYLPYLEPWSLKRAGQITFLEYSEWQGIRCLFSTRIGGVSRRPYNSLNLSHDVNDDSSAVEENVRRFRAATDIHKGRIVRTKQVHSNRVNLFRSQTETFTGDGLITRAEGVWLAVSVADCVPVYVCDTQKQVIGIAHAGWRGTLAGVTRMCIERMRDEFGCDPTEMSAIMGPGIASCCFEVSSEVASQFEELYPGTSSATHVDLFGANRIALENLGVACHSFEPICTSCEEEFFFSHRRDSGVTGRMSALISITQKVERRT